MPNTIKRICVFCGSNPGNNPAYLAMAKTLGPALVARNIELVYGGGNIGLMGAIADAVLSAGGKVIGVIPGALKEKEVAHLGLTELHVVASMHERKAKMAELADAFITLPGGFGTLEELFEIATWAQLGFHSKPFGILDAGDYYTHLFQFLRHTSTEGFAKPEHVDMFLRSTDPEDLLERLASTTLRVTHKWVEREEL